MRSRKTRSLSWIPVWRGAVYCSPACGAGCLRSAYNRAVKAADDLAANLGSDWTSRVWENLDWHYEVISPCGRLKLSSGADIHGRAIRYHAFLGDTGPGGRWHAIGRTPRAAVRRVIATGLFELNSTTEIFRGLVVP